jgi:hypothetical protein
MSFSYELSDWWRQKEAILFVLENFGTIVRAAPDAEDLASQVSKETQNDSRAKTLPPIVC